MKKKVIFLLLLSGFSVVYSAGVYADEQTQLLRRIFMLEYALAPGNPFELAQQWARAVQTRNAAVQYMLLCPHLQANYLNQYEQLNWVTGTSSPRVTSFQIQAITSNRFKIVYTYSPKLISTVDEITVKKIPPSQNNSQQWCITRLQTTTVPLKERATNNG